MARPTEAHNWTWPPATHFLVAVQIPLWLMSTSLHTAAVLGGRGGDLTGMPSLNTPYGTQGDTNTFQLSP